MGTKVYEAVGFDPGEDGAIVYLQLSGSQVEIIKSMRFKDHPLENPLNLLRECKMFMGKNVECFIEDVHAMPLQGLASTFKFGVKAGLLHMFVKGVLKKPYHLIKPQEWQRPFKHVTKKTLSTKKRTREAFDFWVADPRGFSEGEVDACMIALGGLLKKHKLQLVVNGKKTLKFPVS